MAIGCQSGCHHRLMPCGCAGAPARVAVGTNPLSKSPGTVRATARAALQPRRAGHRRRRTPPNEDD